MENQTNNRTQCEECKNKFPPTGIHRILPVQYGWTEELETSFYCLKCRLSFFNEHNELYQPGVETHPGKLPGSVVVPRISESEARLRYCLDDAHIAALNLDIGHYVAADGSNQQVNLFREKDVLDQARWMFGGDIGITNARSINIHGVHLPPVGQIRERRNYLRHWLFVNGGHFAAPELDIVQRYVEQGELNLETVCNHFHVNAPPTL